MTWRAIAALALVGCGGVRPATSPAAAPSGATLALPGTGNGVYWDAASRTLYLTDDTHRQLVAWTDVGGLRVVGAFHTASAQLGLGAIARMPDGSFVVPSFGFGKDGTLLTMSADGTQSAVLRGLDGVRRRIAIARAGDGALYDVYFVASPGGKHAGGIARVTIDAAAGTASETDVPTSTALDKVVGIAASGDALLVCDQGASKLLSVAPASGATSVVAAVPSCDHVVLLPNGDVITGARDHVLRVAHTGEVTTVLAGLTQVRGVAYDPAGGRIFVVDHVPAKPPAAAAHGDTLHIAPLP